ncbi:MAG TPA: XRE family transcriptional regulator [Solirubrobacterales bacterium]|nr:XRE family transcriptional regulator [Solirubrobacterales bacterium]
MANTEESEPVEAIVRRRLRALRTEQGLTLEDVADRAAIDVSTLSRLESGKRRLSLDHLPALAGALGVGVNELLQAPEPSDPRVKGHSHTHDGLTFLPLTRRGPAGGVYAYKIRIDAARNTPPAKLPVHEGHDWMYILDGRMRLCLGDDDMVISPGEAVEFTTLNPHWFGVVKEPVELIALLGPQGERLHLHD